MTIKGIDDSLSFHRNTPPAYGHLPYAVEELK